MPADFRTFVMMSINVFARPMRSLSMPKAPPPRVQPMRSDPMQYYSKKKMVPGSARAARIEGIACPLDETKICPSKTSEKPLPRKPASTLSTPVLLCRYSMVLRRPSKEVGFANSQAPLA